MHLVLATLGALPWLQGFFVATGVSEDTRRDVAEQLSEWREPDSECVAGSHGGLRLRAELAPTSPGDETVLASYTQGVFVLDGEHHVLAQAPPLPCTGSADELVAIAVGDAQLPTPVLALAATTGGHAESVTWLTIYRVANSGELQPVFTGEVERHEGHTTRTGLVTILPGGLVYRDPRGSLSMWLYDATLGRYVRPSPSRPSV
ncbi:MAG TPA: hypothetical protein VLB44_22680 [Kofleriaceae bacterium]|nr:hypothetical protein [Kofleriaceae bacterium]